MMRMTLWGMNNICPLFADVALPDGMSNEIVVNAIMDRCGDLYPQYQVPPRLKVSITNWFERNKLQFERQWQALNSVYNPIENYDRIEDSNTVLEFGSANDSTATGQISAYNSGSFDNDSKNTVHSADSGQNENTMHSRIHGNIGVTTATQMIEAELTMREYDIYARIAERFEAQFMMQLY